MSRSIRAELNERLAPPVTLRVLPAAVSQAAHYLLRPSTLLGLLGGTLLFMIWAWPSAYLAFTVDDSFYYLQTARNLAAGFGATFDRVEPTDGYHPLWLYVVAGCWRVLDACGVSSAAVAMRLLLSLQLLLVATAAHWLSRVRVLSVPFAAAWLAAILSNFYGAKILVNGQESALQFALLALALGVFVQREESSSGSPRWALGLGALAGLCALARLEAALFGLATAATVAWQGAGDRRGRLLDASWLLLGFTLVFAPYLVQHYAATGHVMPVSGSIKADLPGGLAPLLRGVLAAALLASAFWLARASLTRLFLRQLLPLWAYVLGLQTYLVVARGELFPAIWYLAPHALLVTVLLGRGLTLERWRRLGATGPAIVVLLGLLCMSTWLYRVLPSSYARYRVAADLGAWLDEHATSNARVASWDAGIIGAHTQRSVANLDGLINSWDFKLRYLDVGRTEQYLSDRGVTHLVQYFARSWLRKGELRWQGVDLRHWRVAEARCFDLRRVAAFWRTERWAFLVLQPEGEQPQLADWARSDPCGG